MSKKPPRSNAPMSPQPYDDGRQRNYRPSARSNAVKNGQQFSIEAGSRDGGSKMD